MQYSSPEERNGGKASVKQLLSKHIILYNAGPEWWFSRCWSGIKLDISYAFPSLYIFQKDGPYQDVLYSISGAYSCYRPDVGYVQGMSFIVALFILSLEEAVAFIAFGNLMNKPSQLAFYCVDCSKMLKYFGTSEVFFEGSLFTHFLHIK